jgi:hypothetical protein
VYTAALEGEPSVVVVSSVGPAAESDGTIISVTMGGSEDEYWLRYVVSALIIASTKLITVGVSPVWGVVEASVVLVVLVVV